MAKGNSRGNNTKADLEKQVEEIQGKYDELLKKIPKIKKEVKAARKYCKTARKVPRKLIHKRAQLSGLDNKAIEDYKHACKLSFERYRDELRVVLLDVAMNALISGDNRSKKIPWAYYGFVSKKLNCSSATLDLLGMDEEQEELSLRHLLSYIRKKDREGIENSLRKGTGLRHYNAWTSNKCENKRKLSLSTFPFSYHTNYLGVAIFLRDLKTSPYGKRIEAFENTVGQIAETTIKQLDTI